VLCSLSEGVFPTRRARTRAQMEEERRLCFVALTRAKDELVLTQAAGADFEGGTRTPSRFLLDIDPALLDWQPKPAESLLEQARARIFEPDSEPDPKSGTQDWKPGDRVKHAVFGPGEIIAIDAEKSAWVIRFDSLPTPRSIAFRIRLEREGDAR